MGSDSSSHKWTAYLRLLFWIFVSYAFVTYMPTPARAGILLVGLVVIWCLFLWAYSKKPRKRYRTPQETFSLVLGLCSGVVWKITGADVWGRLAIACVIVGGGYRAVYRAIESRKRHGSPTGG
jgi:hypothetical protein